MLECTDVHIPELMVQMDDAFTDLTVMTQCIKVGGGGRARKKSGYRLQCGEVYTHGQFGVLVITRKL